MEIFELEKEQQLAFNRLKRAYADCEKAGVFFYNNYACLGAVNGKLIEDYNDSNVSYAILDKEYNQNHIKIAIEWSDDAHYFHPTELYKKIIEKEGVSKALEGF